MKITQAGKCTVFYFFVVCFIGGCTQPPQSSSGHIQPDFQKISAQQNSAPAQAVEIPHNVSSPQEISPQKSIASEGTLTSLSADEIIQKVDEVRSPQLDYATTVQVESFSPHGATKSATYEVLVKGKDKTIVKTILPEVERGRILLMTERNLWAFFPDVSKPLRISMQERLIGDVSNGDIARVNFSGDYTPTLLRIEVINSKDYYVLELVAKSSDVTYGRAIIWAQKDNFWPFKAEFYALSGKLLKTCSYENYTMLAGALRPSRLVMVDPLIQGKKSIVRYDSIRSEEIPEKYFTKDYMKKLMQ